MKELILKIEINLKSKRVVINDKIYNHKDNEQKRQLEQAIRILNQV